MSDGIGTGAAAACALLGWRVVERYRDGKASALGAASGAVHLVGGSLGALLIGLWGTSDTGGSDGMDYALHGESAYRLW